MTVVIFTSLFWARVVALSFTCTAFAIALNGGPLYHDDMANYCYFCWGFSFACTLVVLLVEIFGLQTCVPVSWTNFPITAASYSAFLCLSASVLFPLYFTQYKYSFYSEVLDYYIISTVFSCLATLAYMVEVYLSRPKPGETIGYMATTPGLLKVCQTCVACIIFIYVSNPPLYICHPALKWCLAVYCLCFILSMAVVVLCVGEFTGCLPVPFSRFLSTFGTLAFMMYLSATVIWPLFHFGKFYYCSGIYRSRTITVTVLTVLNFLLYLADLVYTARLAFTSA